MQITTILSDFSRVLLFPKDRSYTGTLNGLYAELLKKYGTFNVFDFFELNEELFSFFDSLKGSYSLNIFTTGTIQNNPQIQHRINPIFERIFSAESLGLTKEDAKAYIILCKKMGKEPGEIFFTDDTLKNVQAAEQAGLQVFRYENNKSLLNRFHELITF